MALAPKDIDLPGVERRPYGLLLDVARPIPKEMLSERSIERWQIGGVTFSTWGCSQEINVQRVDCDDLLTITDVDDFGDIETSLPFEMYLAIQCSTLSSDPEEMDRRLDGVMSVKTSAAMARELLTGTNSGGIAFDSEADILSNTSESVLSALVRVEDWLATTLDGGLGFVHMSPAVLVLATGSTAAYFDGDNWRTPSGHIIVADAGYATSVTPSGGGATAASSSQRWIYASGPVFYATTEVERIGRRNQESTDMTRNVHIFRSHRYGLLAFDPCAVAATKVTVL